MVGVSLLVVVVFIWFVLFSLFVVWLLCYVVLARGAFSGLVVLV